LLYYARAVDPTMLVALSTLASEQAQGTSATADDMHQLLDYCTTHPDAEVRFHSSDMVLQVSSDASYLSEPEARSRTGVHFYLGNNDDRQQQINGPILCLSSIIKHVMSSATEVEVGSIFSNVKEAVPLRVVLEEMGHRQPPPPIQTDNSTAYGILNNKLNQKRSKAMDMRFYWVRDRIAQKQYRVYWESGSENLADYFTKHHSPTHHKEMRRQYVHNKLVPMIRFNAVALKHTARVC
jgi:hypothetical protein